MSQTTTRLAITAFATAGMYWAALALSHPATASPVTETSPGVPCVGILQDLAASPASVPKAVQNGLFAPAQGSVPAPAAAPVVPAAAPVPPAGVLEAAPPAAAAAPLVPAAAAPLVPAAAAAPCAAARPPLCPLLRRPRRLRRPPAVPRCCGDSAGCRWLPAGCCRCGCCGCCCRCCGCCGDAAGCRS